MNYTANANPAKCGTNIPEFIPLKKREYHKTDMGGLSYTLVKGLKKVDGEMGIIFTCYNLRRTISIMGVEKLLKKLKK